MYYQFDSLAQAQGVTQPINIYGMRVNLNTNISQATFLVENNSNQIDQSLLKEGARIGIRIAKHSSFFADPNSYALVGFIDYASPKREDTGMFDLAVTAYEAKRGLYDTQMIFERNAPLADITDPFSNKAKDYTVKAHMRRLLEKAQFTVLGDQSVVDRFGLDLSGISDNLRIFLPNVSQKYKSAGFIMDALCDPVDAIWYLKYTGNTSLKVVADFPATQSVAVQIKNGPRFGKLISEGGTENPNRISFISERFDMPSSSLASSGHATRLFAVTRIDKHIVSESPSQTNGDPIITNSTSLTNKAIYQTFETNETQFNEINFVAAKKGDPQSPKSRLNGSIVTNKVVGGINMPDQVLANWHVDLDDLDPTPTNIVVNLDDLHRRFIKQKITFGIVWWQRSGVKGDPNTDEANTVLIYRDNSTSGTGASVAAGGDQDDFEKNKLVWKKDTSNYAYKVKSSLQRLFAVTNYTAANDVGFIEPDAIDLNEIDDVNLATRYVSGVLYVASLYKAEPRLVVSNPDNFVFKPYQNVMLYDYLAVPTGVSLQLQDITYDFTQSGNDVQIGGICYVDSAWPSTWPCRQVL